MQSDAGQNRECWYVTVDTLSGPFTLKIGPLSHYIAVPISETESAEPTS
jgi:hypothetical protein